MEKMASSETFIIWSSAVLEPVISYSLLKWSVEETDKYSCYTWDINIVVHMQMYLCICLGWATQHTLKLGRRLESSILNKWWSSSINIVTTSHEVCSSVQKGSFLTNHLNVSYNTFLFKSLCVNETFHELFQPKYRFTFWNTILCCFSYLHPETCSTFRSMMT